MALAAGCSRRPVAASRARVDRAQRPMQPLRATVSPRPGAMGVRRARSAGAVVVQANLFARVARIIKANISNFTAQFEDPEVMLDRVIDEMNEDLVRMRQATAKVMASERQMAAKYAQAQETADGWLRRAELAVRNNQDDLAREALARRRSAESAAQSLKTQLDAQRRALEQLTANVRVLESKVTEGRNKRETLKSRAAAAKSSKQVQEMVAGLRLNTTNAWAAFDMMEEKVVAMEAEAEAVGILATPDSLESKFAALEGGSGVDAELAALKRGMLAERTTGSPAQAQQGQALGRPLFNDVIARGGNPEIESELEALRKRARAS